MLCDNYLPMVCPWGLVSDNDSGGKLETVIGRLLDPVEMCIELFSEGFAIRLTGCAYGCEEDEVCRKISTAYIEKMVRVRIEEPDEGGDGIPKDVIWVVTNSGESYYMTLDCCNSSIRKIIEDNNMCEVDMSEDFEDKNAGYCGIVTEGEKESPLVTIAVAR